MYARTVFDPLAIITAQRELGPLPGPVGRPQRHLQLLDHHPAPGVVFHDGTPLNGAALLMNFEAHLHSLLVGPVAQAGRRRHSPRPGPWRCTMNLKQPWIPFPYYLAGGIGGQIAYPMAPP